jgi:hypothetical protein
VVAVTRPSTPTSCGSGVALSYDIFTIQGMTVARGVKVLRSYVRDLALGSAGVGPQAQQAISRSLRTA